MVVFSNVQVSAVLFLQKLCFYTVQPLVCLLLWFFRSGKPFGFEKLPDNLKSDHRPYLQTLFDPAFISFYNVFYTSLPVLVLGIFDQDVDDVFSVRFPLLYTPGLIDLLFNKMVFLKSVAHGIITSFVLFFVSYGAFKNAVGPEGINLDGHQIFGTVVSTILVIVVTAQVDDDVLT